VQRQLGDVLAAFAQRRDRQGDDFEAVEQVLAEAPGGHLGAQVAVGGGDDAHVDGHLGLAADRADAPLERPQQLGLQRERSSPISSRNRVPPLA
jgi:hypothetical protein